MTDPELNDESPSCCWQSGREIYANLTWRRGGPLSEIPEEHGTCHHNQGQIDNGRGLENRHQVTWSFAAGSGNADLTRF